jgi:hypothetical protein
MMLRVALVINNFRKMQDEGTSRDQNRDLIAPPSSLKKAQAC